MYDMFTGLKENTEFDNLLGPVAYKKQEDFQYTTSLHLYMEEFIKYDIKKFYGYNFKDFMSISMEEYFMLIDHAKLNMKRIEQEMEELEKEELERQEKMKEKYSSNIDSILDTLGYEDE